MRSLHQSGPEGHRDKEIALSQFISSQFEGVGQVLPGDFAGLLMSRPGSSQLGTLVAKRCRIGFLEMDRVCSIVVCSGSTACSTINSRLQHLERRLTHFEPCFKTSRSVLHAVHCTLNSITTYNLLVQCAI